MKRSLYIFGALIGALFLSGWQTQTRFDTPEWVAGGLIVLIIVLFFILAKYSNILRDEVDDNDQFNQNAIKLQARQKNKLLNPSLPFSLSKVQFGLWTVIIASSYIYLSFMKGNCADAPINKTALVLMGIVAGTAAASTLMDKREINNNQVRHQNSPSEGFFVDILSDDKGISLHRFQNFVWTVIAMVIYIYRVAQVQTGCILPELSDTLLALTGISSVTYLVLRSKENDAPAADVSASAASEADKKVATSDGLNITNPITKPQPSIQ
jgi:hypothetical protein